MARLEALEQLDEVLGVVASTGHEMASAHVDPFDLREPWGKALFDHAECVFEVVGGGFAERVEVETLDAIGELGRELVANDAKARAWRAWVVEVGFDIGIFGIDAHTT